MLLRGNMAQLSTKFYCSNKILDFFVYIMYNKMNDYFYIKKAGNFYVY